MPALRRLLAVESHDARPAPADEPHSHRVPAAPSWSGPNQRHRARKPAADVGRGDPTWAGTPSVSAVLERAAALGERRRRSRRRRGRRDRHHGDRSSDESKAHHSSLIMGDADKPRQYRSEIGLRGTFPNTGPSNSRSPKKRRGNSDANLTMGCEAGETEPYRAAVGDQELRLSSIAGNETTFDLDRDWVVAEAD